MATEHAKVTPDVFFRDVSECTYTECYCEENVWHLCNDVKKKQEERLEDCYCVFISNHDRTDYHVIFVDKRRFESDTWALVYDLDTTLSFPCPFVHYTVEAIRSCHFLKPNFRRLFRVIKAKEFISVFASDRSHMLNKEQKWLKPPPDYPCIQTGDCTNNLQDFISMDPTTGVGTVMNLDSFEKFFTSVNS